MAKDVSILKDIYLKSKLFIGNVGNTYLHALGEVLLYFTVPG